MGAFNLTSFASDHIQKELHKDQQQLEFKELAGPITAKYTSTNVTCYNGHDGNITFSNLTGATNYQYSIDGGISWQASPSFTGLATQSYTLVVRDADNPVNTNTLATIQITQPNQLEAIVTATSETFAGAKDGAITISSQKGGSGAYEYSIDGINYTNSSQFIGIASGVYTVWVRDLNVLGCFISIQKVIQYTGTLIADVTHANVLCNGGNTGSILFSNASGATSIEYSIDSGATWNKTGVFNGLPAGSYDVAIRDANNTINKVSLGNVIVTQPTKLLATYSNYTPPLCAGNSGSLTIYAIGGTPPYQGVGDFVIPSGAYRSFIVSDKNGCTVSMAFSMPDPPKIVATAVVNPPNYCNENGTIEISGTGGTGALKGTGTFVVQAGKSYIFKITDANGCSSNIISGVMPNTDNTKIPIVIAETVIEIDFQKQQLGAIDLQVTGGTESYTYQWSNGAITRDIHDLQNGGTYTVTVTDSNGCMKTKSVALAMPNYLPIAKAGADQIVYEGVTVTLDGSGSSDANQDNLTYIWTAPKGILLSNSTSSKPSFLAPEVKRDTIISITLVVNDGKVSSSPATVKIAIQNVIKVGNATPLELSSIKIYPNPTAGILKIEGLPANQRNKISLFTIDGRLIKKKSSNSENESIDICKNPSGFYILHINNQSFKIVKE